MLSAKKPTRCLNPSVFVFLKFGRHRRCERFVSDRLVVARCRGVYRLDHVQEAIDLGLDELFEGAVTLIEWGDGVRDLLPVDRLEVELKLPAADEAADDTRQITITPFGPVWLGRAPALSGLLLETADGDSTGTSA